MGVEARAISGDIKNWNEVVDPECREDLVQARGSASKSATTVVCQFRNGTIDRRFLEIRYFPVTRHDGTRRTIAIGRDITRDRSPEDQQIFRQFQSRLNSITLVHQHLNQEGSPSEIDLGQYCANLCRILAPRTTDGAAITLETHVDHHLVPAQTASTVGLVISELITNAEKHAFGSESEHPEIVVAFRRAPDACYEVAISDNGHALDQGPLRVVHDSQGMRLLLMLAEKLSGEITFKQDSVTKTFTVRWPAGKTD